MSRDKDTLSATIPYDRDKIAGEINGFKVTKRAGVVTTSYNGIKLSSYEPSKNYEVVDFKKAVNDLLNHVHRIMKPSAYNLTIKASYQELKIKGKKYVINGDVFHEMLWLTNSTNGTKKLSIRYGVMRQVCSNGMCVVVKGTSIKVKHLESNQVNSTMDIFIDNLPDMDVREQVSTLEEISKKTITVRKVANALVNEIGEKGNDSIWKKLARKLASSKTDSLGTEQDALIKGINVPFKQMTKETLDAKLPAWKVLNCYTELWRSLDAGEIERETGKIMAILS